jgi:hypothetical protein
LILIVSTTAACKQKHLFSVWTQLTVGTFFPLLLILLLMRFWLSDGALTFGPGVTRDRLFGTMALGRRNYMGWWQKEELFGVMAEGGTVWGEGGRRNCLRGWRREELFEGMAEGGTVWGDGGGRNCLG